MHATACIILLGRAYPEIDDYMDSMQPILQSKHRLMYHDIATIEAIAEIDEGAGRAALLHVILDAVSDVVGQENAIPVTLRMIEEGVF